MSRLPIRARLTLAFATAMAALLAGAGFLLLDHLAGSLDRTINQSLRTRATDIAALVKQADTGLRQRRSPAGAESFAQVLRTTRERSSTRPEGLAHARCSKGTSSREHLRARARHAHAHAEARN